jgi:phosphoribosylglycinamide formyltransferase 1
MTLHVGWFSTGRDPAARNLLQTVHRDLTENHIPASIDWIFCHRQTGDGAFNEEYRERELFFDLAAGLNIPCATLSHVHFLPELRKQGILESRTAAEPSPALNEWRNLFGREVMKMVSVMPPVDLIIMAGYMLILGDPELGGLVMVNIHPALPWGPRGTWQEVIHQLIAEPATEQGIMVHLVTKELDRGPVISYCRFPILGEGWDRLWDEWKQDISADAARDARENHPLFKEIRRQGEVRELPLLRSAIRELAFGNISIRDKTICAAGKPLEHGVDLTGAIEDIVSTDKG